MDKAKWETKAAVKARVETVESGSGTNFYSILHEDSDEEEPNGEEKDSGEGGSDLSDVDSQD